MAGSEIKNNLEAILAARSQKAEEQRASARKITQMWAVYQEKLKQIHSCFSGLKPGEQEKLCEGGAAALLRNIQAEMDACEAAVQKAASELENLAIRFSRSTVNLVVVGAMGAGKSKFLQSASGLLDDCIPSYAGRSCTGVTSIIENGDTETEALLTFKSRQEALEDMRREINDFARRLHAEAEISGEMSDFTAGVHKLEKLRNIADQEGQRILSAEDGAERTVDELDKRDLDDLLALYNQHLTVWEPYLDGQSVPGDALEEREEDGVRQYVLKDRIEEYVSKHGKDDTQRYYKYAAIKKAVIRTRFSDQIDAHIRLIDTVGIGDPAVDTEARLADAVRNDADGVIFILCAGPHRMYPVKQDRVLIEKFQDIYHSYSNKEVDEDGMPRKEKRTKYWMAFLVNDLPIDGMPENNAQLYLDQAIIPAYNGKNKIFGKEGIVYKRALNVAKPEQVEQMISEFLKQISDNLKEIDAGIEISAKQAKAKAETQVQALRKKLRDIRINQIGDSRLIYIAEITKTRLDLLRGNLGDYAGEILSNKVDKSENESFLQQCLSKVRCLKDDKTVEGYSFCGGSEDVSLERIVNHYIDYYKSEKVEDFFPKTRLAVFDALQDVIREIGSRPLAQQEEAEGTFKKKIADELIKCLNIDFQKPGDSSAKALDASDSHFFRKISETLTGGLPYMEEVKETFLSMDQFKLDHSNGITKALFCSLAAEHLCDTPYNVPEFPPDGDTNKDRLLKELKQKLETFIDAVNQRTMSEIYLVGENDQKYHELVYFIRILDKIYESKWLIIFDNLDKQNLLRGDTESWERLAAVAAAAEDLDALLRKI